MNPRAIIWAIVISACYATHCVAQTSGGLPPLRNPAPETRQPIVDPRDLINRGWGEFVGRSGIVNESKALELTIDGFNGLKQSQNDQARSVGLNNISVFHSCSFNKKIRNCQRALDMRVNGEYKDAFSVDNMIWHIFLNRFPSITSSNFVDNLKVHYPTHPVNRYVDRLGGRLPNSQKEAYAILEGAADEADPDAARWLAFRYECGEEAPQIHMSIEWYRKAVDFYTRAGAPQSRIDSVQQRLRRLILVGDGHIVN